MKLSKIIFLALVAFACEKQEIKKESQILDNVTVNVLLAYNDSTVYERSDSALVEVYKNNVLIQSGHTVNGKLNVVPVDIEGDYYFTFKTRTYKDGSKVYHFKGQYPMQLKYHYIDTNLNRGYFKNYYACIGCGIGREDGNGTTDQAIKDNFGIVQSFKAW